ncbi:MAG TPA: SRPBCC family protein [Pedobacter sp.]|nr:SRPBCC family protein [Pedobacter sp.]
MKAYHLTFNQKIPLALNETWDFFSSPLNLAKITPPDMAFTVTSNQDQIKQMYPGLIITYKVSPISGIKIDWMTEITHVSEGNYFIDEQRFGPYQFWHHQHHFKAIEGGTDMTDILTYGLPLGALGRIANQIYVADKLQQIFEYRKQKINELFGNYPAKEV